MVPVLPMEMTGLFAPIMWATTGFIFAGLAAIVLAILLNDFRHQSSHRIVLKDRGAPERPFASRARDRVLREASR